MKTFEEAILMFACHGKEEEAQVRERLDRYNPLLREIMASQHVMVLVTLAIQMAEDGVPEEAMVDEDAVVQFALMCSQLFAQGVLVGMEMEKQD